MKYVDYHFYTCVYHGKVTGQVFDRLAPPASAYIDTITFRRIKCENDISDNVKFAICSVIDVMHKKEQSETGNVASEKAGETAISYFDPKVSKSMWDQEKYKAAEQYLIHTNLLRGWL